MRLVEELSKSFVPVRNRAGSDGDWKINVSEGWVVEKIKRVSQKTAWPDTEAVRAWEGKVDARCDQQSLEAGGLIDVWENKSHPAKLDLVSLLSSQVWLLKGTELP